MLPRKRYPLGAVRRLGADFGEKERANVSSTWSYSISLANAVPWSQAACVVAPSTRSWRTNSRPKQEEEKKEKKMMMKGERKGSGKPICD